MNVLIVDDEQSVRDSFELALEDRANTDIRTAENGLEALSIVEQWSPELVFLDLKMPKMNGIETLRALKQKFPKLPVYIVTAFAREFMPDLKTAQTEGLQFELAAKPITLDQINMIVDVYQHAKT